MPSMLNLNSRLKELKPSHIAQLALMLDPLDTWKRFAAAIKTRRGQPMFNIDQIEIITYQTALSGRSPTKEVIHGWITDNPSIDDLLTALEEIKVFRAVAYINKDILNVQYQVPVDASDTTTGSNGNDQVVIDQTFQSSMSVAESTNSDVLQSDELTTGVDHLSIGDCEKFSYDFLAQVTDNFSCIPLSDGGRLVGEGGFGQVFKGVHCKFPDMAVKRFLAMCLFDDQLARKQFVTELNVLSKCRHENILPLIGYCDEERLCVVYQYMVNGSLEDRLACKNGTPSLPVAVRLKIMKGVARGLVYLHSRSPPLIHRDIKSANILLDDNFTAKIGDCGTVRVGPQGSKTSTHTQVAIGTCPYMPKEYIEDNEVSIKMDAYSLGVVLLEVLTGLPAFSEDREDRSLPTHINETVEDDDILAVLDRSAGDWGDSLPHDMYKLSKQFMEYKLRRITVEKALPQIESW